MNPRRLVYQIKEAFVTTRNYEIVLHMRLWQYVGGKYLPEFPEGYKFNWIAYNIENPKEELVLFDNHHGKAPHWHLDQDKKGKNLSWTSREEMEKLFFQKVWQRFGYFEFRLK